ncbi:heavy metal translocating P-type ATPase [Flavobacterium sp.]|uniref:heavy metal translocating P-type ATPase n=1 Tax=Flavobacterium sp. TaxID=239 RepID=UPI000BFFEB5A|nr:copper transporter [Nostoc linckia z15]
MIIDTENNIQPNTSNLRDTYAVLGMSCAACAVSVEDILKKNPEVINAGVNYATQSAWIEYRQGTKPEQFQNLLRAVGYDLIIDAEDPEQVQEDAQRNEYKKLKRRTILASLLSFPVVILGMFFMDMPYGNWIMMLFSAPVVFYIGSPFFITAYRLAKHRKANMDTLVALSTGIAFTYSAFNTIYPEYWHRNGLHAHVYFEAAAVVIAFISLGKLLEEKAKSKTSSAIKKLIGLQPKTIKILIDGQEVEIPIAQVSAGQDIVVKPGEKIAVDGEITEGESYIDESMITGEPVPVSKAPGDKVYAGTINQKGSFIFRAEKVGSDTILAQIIKMVQQAQGSKAPVQKTVDKIAGIFVPVVIGVAIVTFFAWMLLSHENAFNHALQAAVTVLVIACPCALGLATPTAIMVAVGKGAENNILVRDAESLETLHKVNAVILDKTGTITTGKPAVTAMKWISKTHDNAINRGIIKAIEARSEHPLAGAVVKFMENHTLSMPVISQFESLTGKGVMAEVQGNRYYIGSKKLLSELNITLEEELLEDVQLWQNQARTVIYFFNVHQVLAALAIEDAVKKTSAYAIARLQASNIEVYMLTGDNQQTAKAVADLVQIKNYRAEVMPADKAAFVRELQLRGKKVAMVGDGINDSQALAQADVSIAMGTGSDIAMDVAKMTLITSDLNSIPKAIDLSRKTVITIRQNLFWAFIYNIIGIPLAAGALYWFNGFLLDPMIAGAAMACSSVSVVLNSLRLMKAKL